MHVALWEGDRDAFGVEAQFHLLGQVKINGPVVFRGDKRPYRKIHAAVGQFAHGYGGCGFGGDARVAAHQFLQDHFSPLQIVILDNAKDHVQAQ